MYPVQGVKYTASFAYNKLDFSNIYHPYTNYTKTETKDVLCSFVLKLLSDNTYPYEEIIYKLQQRYALIVLQIRMKHT